MSTSCNSTVSTLHRCRRQRRGAIVPILLAGLVALGCLIALMYYSFFGGTDEVVVDAIMKEVTRDEFVAKVLDQGEVQSAENVEIKCEVGSRNGSISVIDVVPEGTKVYEGDWLVSLDATAFEKELEQQKIAVSNAETQLIQSKASLEAAKASKEEYENGTFQEQLATAENDIFNAVQELNEARAYLAHSVKLQGKGFITKQQLRSDEIQVEKSENSVKLAEQSKNVLVNITYKKETILLDSDIAAAEVALRTAEESLAIEERQLEEIREQLEFCDIRVPEGVSGEVVYHKEFDRRGGSEWVLEPGANVRERQVLIKLPNPDKMEVKVLINEQSITAIRPGYLARISVDALPNLSMTGEVTKVNSYAEQGGWGGSSSVREYAVFVRIHEPPAELIPGMNASVSIQTEYQENVLQAPLQCIYAANNTNFVLRKVGENQFETAEVKIAGENSQNVWIESGVEEGDMLVMDPGQYKELMDLPEQKLESRIQREGSAASSAEAATADQAPESRGGGERGKGERGERGGQKRGEGGGRGGMTGGGGGGFNVDMIIDRTMERYDTNGDDVIDADEQAAFEGMASRMTDADKDGDGKITRDEVKSYMSEAMKRFGGGAGR